MFEKEEPVAAQQILDVWFRRRQQQVTSASFISRSSIGWSNGVRDRACG